jgi:hypothetical protein
MEASPSSHRTSVLQLPLRAPATMGSRVRSFLSGLLTVRNACATLAATIGTTFIALGIKTATAVSTRVDDSHPGTVALVGMVVTAPSWATGLVFWLVAVRITRRFPNILDSPAAVPAAASTGLVAGGAMGGATGYWQLQKIQAAIAALNQTHTPSEQFASNASITFGPLTDA